MFAFADRLALCAIALTSGLLLIADVVPRLEVGGGQTNAILKSELTTQPISRAAVLERTNACLDTLHPAKREMLTARMRDRVASNCGRLAAHIRTLWPTDARGNIVLSSLVAAIAGEGTRVSNLGEATAKAPNQGWMAELRLVELLLLGDMEEPARRSDIWHQLVTQNASVALLTDSGADLVAAWYVRRPALRDVLGEAIEQAAPDHRTRAIARIRIGGRV